MKLFGYIKEYMECSFTVPIYTDDNDYYVHKLDDNFLVTSFDRIHLDDFVIPLKKTSSIKIGAYGIIIFKGFEKATIYGTPNKCLVDIAKYLDDIALPRKYISKELFNLASSLNINLQNFETKHKIKLFLKKESEHRH